MHIKNERRCVACRQNKLQNDMLRVAKISTEFCLDLKQKLGGRGAYVCKCSDCLKQAIKKRAFNRAFKTNVDETLYQLLGEYEQNS